MDHFFDLKDFLIAILKRLKLLIIVVFLCTIGVALLRFIPLIVQVVQYETYDGVTTQEKTSSEQEDSSPYTYSARKIIYISPIYKDMGNNVINEAELISNAYQTYARAGEITAAMIEQYYAQAQTLEAKHRQNLIDYNYRTKAIWNISYTTQSFIDTITCDRLGSSFVNLYITSSSQKFADMLIDDYEKMLTALVTEKMGKFEYTVENGRTGFWLPDPQDGLQPKLSLAQDTTQIINKPSISAIIKSTVKGGIIGGVLGVAISVVIIFFTNVVGISVTSEQDLNQFNRKILGITMKKKKGLFHALDRWVSRLEGHVSELIDMKTCCAMAYERILLSSPEMDESFSLLFTGCEDNQQSRAFVEEFKKYVLAQNKNWSIDFSPCIVYHSETIKMCGKFENVILLEQTGISNKAEIQRELDCFENLNKAVIGFILLK